MTLPLSLSRWFLGAALALGLAGVAAAQESPASTPAAPPADEPAVLTVGEWKLTAADVERLMRALPPQHRAFYSEQGRHLLPQYLVRLKVLAAEARKHKLEQSPEVQRAVELATESILADAARRELEQGIPVEEEQLGKLYEQRRPQFEEARVRRLLIRTETSILSQSYAAPEPPLSSVQAREKLEEIRQEILSGGDFAHLAQEHSDDLATAGAGGDQGYLDRQQMIPPIAQAAFSLAPGEISEIIPTPYGLELIQVVDRRVKPLEQVRPQLEAELRRNQLEAALLELIQRYPVQVDTQYFQAPPGSHTQP